MNIGRKTRDAIAFAAIVVVCAAVSVSPLFNIAHGLSIDILTALRWEMFGRRHDPAASPAVVVAIDEETYQAPPLERVLDTFWDAGSGIQQIVFYISPPLTPLPQIKRLGPQPFPNVNILELLAPIYETVSAKAMEWAYQVPGQEP